MGQATNLALRERIYELRQQGEGIKRISEQLQVPFGTTKKLCRRFREKGAAGLSPDYSNCGTKTAERHAQHREAAIRQRELHPKWGAPRIRVALQLAGPGTSLPCVRTLQKWYRASGLCPPRRQSGEPGIGRSRAAHNIWEVDAKENLLLPDGSPACYLTIGDEKTGAWLEAVVFPPPENQSSASPSGAKGAVRDL